MTATSTPECPACLTLHGTGAVCSGDPDAVKGEKMRRYRARIAELEAGITVREERLAHVRGVLHDLVDYTDRHRLGYENHDHDCYEEWSLLRDEANNLLRRAVLE